MKPYALCAGKRVFLEYRDSGESYESWQKLGMIRPNAYIRKRRRDARHAYKAEKKATRHRLKEEMKTQIQDVSLHIQGEPTPEAMMHLCKAVQLAIEADIKGILQPE